MLTLDTEIKNISGAGQTVAKRLANIGLLTLKDLLYHFPFRYDDYSQVTPINKLRANTQANVVGRIELIQNKRSARRRMNLTEALVSDASGQLKVIWFNQPFIANTVKAGDQVSLSGKVEADYGGFAMKSPAYEKIILGQTLHTQGIIPTYHSTANITQKQIRFLIAKALRQTKGPEEWLPLEIIKNQNLLSLKDALEKIHFPGSFDDIEKAKRRLAFDEMFLIQLQSQSIKHALDELQAEKLSFKETEIKNFVKSLPFELTIAQKKAAWEILQNLEKERPMSRLLEGDVGSGKTVVAVMALLTASLNKTQSVLMVPTEILAKQHYFSILKILSTYNIGIGLITNSEKKISNISAQGGSASGGQFLTSPPKADPPRADKSQKPKTKLTSQDVASNSDIIIGTHALIQDKLEFNNLSLVIVDEQHRFGVDQRKVLIEKSRVNREKNFTPHILSMTATPIPRSLALTIYGDLDISIINEMPKGRLPIITRVVRDDKRADAYNFIKQQIQTGRQVFVICPLIDISDKLGVKSAKEEFERLDKQVFPHLKIGLLHGKLKPKEKDQVMAEFLANKINILVSTSVVEVGVDIPNATIMMIEAADRFGLAQLHQFRGRVGRGEHQSYCLLFTESDSPKTLERLNAMTIYSDGFSLAKIDLKHRGPGEVYGTAQKGFPELKIASLFDYPLIKAAQEEAQKAFSSNSAVYEKLKEKINLKEKADYRS